jgi:hypothetical protein
MSQPLQDGRWFTVATKEQHDCLKRYGQLTVPPVLPMSARVQIGDWVGPGRYLLLRYSQRCPRNCCDDDVNNVCTVAEVLEAVREQMVELARVRRQARGAE